MPRAALLLHQTPDGASHIDFLLARARGADSPLAAFRLDTRPDTAPLGAILRAVRLPDHRARYLDFEGDIGAGRGSISRLARGVGRIIAETDQSFVALTKWGPGVVRLVGMCRPDEGPDAWRFRVM